jgi:hypothetical protein
VTRTLTNISAVLFLGALLLSPATLHAETCAHYGLNTVAPFCGGSTSSCGACSNCVENECFVYATVTEQGYECFEDCVIGGLWGCVGVCS